MLLLLGASNGCSYAPHALLPPVQLRCFQTKVPLCLQDANLKMLQGVRGLGGMQDELISGGEDMGMVLPSASP